MRGRKDSSSMRSRTRWGGSTVGIGCARGTEGGGEGEEKGGAAALSPRCVPPAQRTVGGGEAARW